MKEISTVVLVLALSGWAGAEEKARPSYNGSEIYRMYCKTCHGPAAKGDGVLAERLKVAPPDLTLLARRDGGKFSAEKVERMIDGRNPLRGHGGPDMPLWGDAFKNSADGYDEAVVKARIKALVEHLESLQEPASK